MHAPVPDELLLLPSLKAVRAGNGNLILTRKFLNGVAMFARFWPGRVAVLLNETDERSTDMDLVEVTPENCAHSLAFFPGSERQFADRLGSVAVVLGFLSPEQQQILQVCKRQGVPVVMTTEYTPATEKQIVDATVKNPLRRLRRKLRINQWESVRRTMLADLDGLQCNGVPTYSLYRNLTPNPMLFFDNRVPASSVTAAADLELRLAELNQRQPLRLVFGGRLLPMKGVQHLPRVAAELKRANVAFSMEIYGSGPLEGALRRDIERLRLTDSVRLCGTLDFESGWLQVLRKQTDLFVCCHPQGDPSSTYTEVMSCGVPIVGYGNEAFSGVVEQSGCGWIAPKMHHRQLAGLIADLAEQRDQIATAAREARDFAAAHTFETSFSARVQHLYQASRYPPMRDMAGA